MSSTSATASPSSFTRYAASVGAALATASLAHAGPGFAVFDNPYKTGGISISPGTLSSSTVSSGAWTWTTNNSGGTVQANSVTSLTLSQYSSLGNKYVDFTTTIVSGFETISFDYSVSNFAVSSASWLLNGSATALSGSGTMSDLVFAPGDVFGFRVTATYGGVDLTVSDFSGSAAVAAVPEPAETAAWMAVGVAGLVAVRELRRRREAAAV